MAHASDVYGDTTRLNDTWTAYQFGKTDPNGKPTSSQGTGVEFGRLNVTNAFVNLVVAFDVTYTDYKTGKEVTYNQIVGEVVFTGDPVVSIAGGSKVRTLCFTPRTAAKATPVLANAPARQAAEVGEETQAAPAAPRPSRRSKGVPNADLVAAARASAVADEDDLPF